jgi:hypothetical protein
MNTQETRNSKAVKEQAEALFQRLYGMASEAKNEGMRPLYKAQIYPAEIEGQEDPTVLRHLIKIANRRAGQLWQLSNAGPVSEAKIFHWGELLEAVMTWIEQRIESYEEITGEPFDPFDTGLTFFDYTGLCPYEELPANAKTVDFVSFSSGKEEAPCQSLT